MYADALYNLTTSASQVHEYRRTGQSSTPRSILDPAATDKPQTATRRTRRKLSVKQPADAGFKSTYSSGKQPTHCMLLLGDKPSAFFTPNFEEKLVV